MHPDSISITTSRKIEALRHPARRILGRCRHPLGRPLARRGSGRPGEERSQRVAANRFEQILFFLFKEDLGPQDGVDSFGRFVEWPETNKGDLCQVSQQKRSLGSCGEWQLAGAGVVV